jgi:drug/metabolite transporter (DMT)-like permease
MPSQTPAISTRREQNIAVAALLLATVFWGCGFTWAKAAGQAVQDAAGLPRGAAFGPVFLLGWRFLLAAILWFILFPASWRGWSWRGLRWALLVGATLGAGLIVQHVGLDRTSEAVSAFLTSLTILFVPLLMVFVIRKPPQAVLWIGVLLATLGVWLMTGAQPKGFGLGELLGLLCAFLFSLYILAVNAASRRETPWRMVGAQFAIVAIMCFITCTVLIGGRSNLHLMRTIHILSKFTVWLNLLLLVTLTTLIAFGLLTFFQPRIDPTRAALIYLAEPVFATLYATAFAGHPAGWLTLVGAAIILLANVLVEGIGAWGGREPQENVVLVD